jgi:hypothetical protein
MVFWVSSLNLSLPSIWLISNFLSFLLSSSNYLHFNAFLRIPSLLTPWPDPVPWFEFTPYPSIGCPTTVTALIIPPVAEPEPELVGWVGYWLKELIWSELSSLIMRFLRALKSSTYWSRASLFFCIMWVSLSLLANKSSTLRSDKPGVNYASLTRLV